MNKEQVYDAQIEPLMSQIIAIAQANGIAMIASFHIPTPEDDGLCCTSMLPNENGESGPGHRTALRAIEGSGMPSLAITLTKAN